MKHGTTAQLVVRDGKRLISTSGLGLLPLASVATVRTSEVPAAIHRLDSKPMVQVTANPATEVSLVQARTLCETLLEQLRNESRLPPEYRLTWLQEIPTPRNAP
jgi:multidrug efflux pump subunit AcrB